MKYLIAICSFIILTINYCIGQIYKIEGEIKNLKSDSLLILKFKGNNIEGSKIKVFNEKFYYRDSVSEPYFIQILKLRNGTNESEGKLADILVESGKIFIKGTNDKYDSIKVTGSKSDLIMKKYLQEDKKLSIQWDSLKEVYDSFVEKGDTINRKKTGQLLNNITLKQRVPLLKYYVQKYNNEIVGALIPNFCTLKDVLKKEDYLEMYNSLSDEIRATKYGQSVYERTK